MGREAELMISQQRSTQLYVLEHLQYYVQRILKRYEQISKLVELKPYLKTTATKNNPQTVKENKKGVFWQHSRPQKRTG